MVTKRRNLSKATVSGVLWTSSTLGAQSTMQLVSIVILARLLSPNEFGVFFIATAVLGFIAIFSMLGVGPAIVQRKELEDRHIRVGFTLSLALSAAIALGIWAAAPLVSAAFAIPELSRVMRAACLVLAFQGASTVAQSLALRNLRFRWLAIVDAASFAAGFVAVAPILAWLGHGVWALVAALLVQHLVRMIALLKGQPHDKRLLIHVGAALDLLYFGGWHSLAQVGNYLARQVDKLIIGLSLGAEALGIYGHAYQLMYAPARLVGKAQSRVLFPTMAAVQLERQRLVRAYRTGVAACALLILPLSIATIIAAPEIVLVLLGPRWIAAVEPLRILALGMMFRGSYKISDAIARATGAVAARAWRQWLFAVATVAGALIGQVWGLEGVAVGVLCAIAFNFFMMAELSLRLTGMSWHAFGVAHRPAVQLSFVVGAAIWAFAGYLRYLGATPFIVLAAIAALATILTLGLWRLFPRSFLGPEAEPILSLIDSKLRESWASVAGGSR